MQTRNMQLYRARSTTAQASPGQWIRLRFWQAAALILYVMYTHKRTLRSLFWVGLLVCLTSAALTSFAVLLFGL